MIGGNVTAYLQQQTGEVTINAIGECIQQYADVQGIFGFLDLSSGDSKYAYDAKIQESTHIFICDYVSLDRFADDKRMTVNGCVYDVLLIDDPMELHQHLEIYLKYIGKVMESE